MKKIGEYTARGIVNETETEGGSPQKIPLFDGSFKTGYRVTSFRIWGSNYSSNSNPDCIGKLSKNDDGVTTSVDFFRADDDNQIAWAVSAAQSEAGGQTIDDMIIDRDNLVIEDLYVYVRAPNNTSPINYLVEMDKYEITDWQGALAMARDRAQGDL